MRPYTPISDNGMLGKVRYNVTNFVGPTFDVGLESPRLRLPGCLPLLSRTASLPTNSPPMLERWPHTTQFQLIIKRYDGGAVSQYLHKLKIGSPVQFKHISFNIKRQVGELFVGSEIPQQGTKNALLV